MNRQEANDRIDQAVASLKFFGWTASQLDNALSGLNREECVERAEALVSAYGLRNKRLTYTVQYDNRLTYTVQYDNRPGMDCFVAIPSADNEDALTLPGSTLDDALAYAKRTGLEVVCR